MKSERITEIVSTRADTAGTKTRVVQFFSSKLLAGIKRNTRVASEEATSREKRGRASRNVPLPSA